MPAPAIDRGILAEVAGDAAAAESLGTLVRERFGDDWRTVLLGAALGGAGVDLHAAVERLVAGGAEEVDRTVDCAGELPNGAFGLGMLATASPPDLQDLVVDRALARFPGNDSVLAVQAGILVDREHPGEALEITTGLVERYPGNAPFLHLHALALLGVGKGDEAEEWLRRSVEADPPYPPAAALLAGMLREHGMLDESLAVVRRMLARAPDVVDLKRLEIAHLVVEGRGEEAVPLIGACLLDDTADDQVVLDILTDLAVEGVASRADALSVPAWTGLRRATRTTRGRASSWRGCCAADERPAEALAAAERAYSLLGEQASEQLRSDRAELLWQTSREEEAIAADLALGNRERVVDLIADSYTSRPPERVLAWLDLLPGAPTLLERGVRAEVLRLLGRASDAWALAEEILAEAPGDAPLFLSGTLAQSLLDLGDPQAALDRVQPVLDANPDYAFGQAVRIAALSWLERYDDAERYLDEHFGADLDESWRSWVPWARGQLLFETARFDAAEVLLVPVAADDPALAGLLGSDPLPPAARRRGGGAARAWERRLHDGLVARVGAGARPAGPACRRSGPSQRGGRGRRASGGRRIRPGRAAPAAPATPPGSPTSCSVR